MIICDARKHHCPVCTNFAGNLTDPRANLIQSALIQSLCARAIVTQSRVVAASTTYPLRILCKLSDQNAVVSLVTGDSKREEERERQTMEQDARRSPYGNKGVIFSGQPSYGRKIVRFRTEVPVTRTK